MKIIEPKVELWQQDDKVAHVARCARVCYKRETGNDEKLIENLYRNHHWSMFRHETHYCVVPTNEDIAIWLNSLYQVSKVMNQKIIGIDIDLLTNYYPKCFLVVFNGNWKLDNIDKANQLASYEINAKEFANYSDEAWNMMRYTFKVTTQISTSRELNRVSPNNIAEQSTRYVYEDGTICKPYWMTDEEVNYLNNEPIFEEWCHFHKRASIFRDSCNDSFNKYKLLVDNSMRRQDARGVLPLDTATRCVYTYSINEWHNIIDLRYYGTTGKPHPNAYIIADMIKTELEQFGYEFR